MCRMPSIKTLLLAVTCAAGMACASLGCAPFSSGSATSYEQARQVLDTPTGPTGSGVRQVSFESEIGKKTREKTLADAIDPSKNFSRATNSVKSLAGQGIDEERAKQVYAEADRIFAAAGKLEGNPRRQEFTEAAETYSRAAARWPESGLEQDAMFMIGESYYFADNYVDAEDAYERLVKKYPSTKHLDRSIGHRYLMAQYWLQRAKDDQEAFYSINATDDSKPWRDTHGHGIRVLDRIRLDDPTSPLADDATLLIANTLFARGKYVEADQYYTDLRRTFPSSEHQFDAHFLGLKAKLEMYQGPQYSGAPLNEAEELVKQLRRQFPRQTGEKQAIIDRAYAEVRMKKAEREWNDGRYFDYRGEYGSSRHYYELIIRDYPGTPHADMARERLAAIADKPDKPPEQFDWFVKIFDPEETELPKPDYSNYSGK
jgi:TolA-binding protein